MKVSEALEVSIAFRLLKRLVVESAHPDGQPQLIGLNCLSAVEAIGSRRLRIRDRSPGPPVSIAFRLLKRLVAVARTFAVGDAVPGLNCLSAVEAIGRTFFRAS